MALVFDVVKAKGKPDDNRRPGTSCPFCDIDGLEKIIRQTVLIESADHDADITTYEPGELHGVIRFALSCWEQMIDSGDYRSVLMYKNMGPLSGGSLTHPHMQIVGLEEEDGYAEISMKHFEGIDVWRRGRVHVTISNDPVMGFFEVNVICPQGLAHGNAPEDIEDTNRFADALQTVVRYVLNELARDAERLRELLDERA